jgi:hypothetical protein
MPSFAQVSNVVSLGQQPSSFDERSKRDARLFLRLHQRATGAIEHPQRNVRAVALLVSGPEATQYDQLRRAPLAAHEQLFPEKRVPLVLKSSAFGFVGVVCVPCITRKGTTKGSTTP